jgi:hypothetical protein
MNKKNSLIIAIVLLLIIGTGSFVFAGTPEQKLEDGKNKTTENKNNNTSNSSKDKNENKKPTTDSNKTDKDDNSSGQLVPGAQDNLSTPSDKTNTQIPIYNTGNNNNSNTSNTNNSNNSGEHHPTPEVPVEPENPPIPEEPTNPSEKPDPIAPEDTYTYEEVLEAVKKAEVTLDTEDIKKAEELLETLKNSDEKNELKNRLEIIKKEKNLMEKVEALEKMIKNAKEKNDLIIIEEKANITALRNEVISLPDNFEKGDLLKRIEKIEAVLNDKIAPILSGIINNTITNQAVVITIDDYNATIMLNGDITTIDEINEMTKNKVNQEYHIVAIDQSFNESTLTFTIDTVLPTAEIEYSHDLTLKTNQEIKATLKNANKDITITNNDGKDFYTFQENGEFIFEITDVAGNTNQIIAKVENIDREKPTYQKLGILNFTHVANSERLDVAYPNDVIKVYVTFNEKLKNNPKGNLNEFEIAFMLDEENSKEGSYVYIAEYTIENEFTEGEVNIKINDYFDEAGNSGEEITNKDINVEEHSRVYVIIEPGLELIPNGFFNTKTITIKDPDFAYMTIQKVFQRNPVRVDTNTYEIPVDGTYTIKVYDKNDNLLQSAKMDYDGTAPIVEAKGTNANTTEIILNNDDEIKEYEKVTMKISDTSLKMIQRVDESGNVLEIYKEYNPIKVNQKFNLELIESGNYIIESIDAANNKTITKFIIK